MEELIIRHLNGQASRDESERIRQWRDRSPANDQLYSSIQSLWALTGAADPLAARQDDPPDAELLIRSAESKSEVELRADAMTLSRRETVPRRFFASSRKPLLPTNLRRAAIAAGLLLVGSGVGLLLDRGDASSPILEAAAIATGSGEMATLTLADGTSIRVGPRSRVRVFKEPTGPVAELDGRAFFAVKRDSARSFTVRTTNGDAVVLGTRFEVRAEDDEFRVLVVDGSVRVQAGGDTVELKEAQIGRAQGNTPLSVDTVDDAYAQLDWMGNALVFQATPLRRALREVERRYSVSVVLTDSALAELRVTASFTGEPLDQVILVLCEISGARCSIEGSVVRIQAKGG